MSLYTLPMTTVRLALAACNQLALIVPFAQRTNAPLWVSAELKSFGTRRAKSGSFK